MIELKNIGFQYEGTQRAALENIDLTIPSGEMLAIVGHNGSGKSTLAKHLNGLLLPHSGTVLIDGMDTKDANLLLRIRQRVGMVFQNPDNQLVTTIVEEDVAFGPESLGVPSAEIRMRVDEALASVHMSEYAQKAPHMLSGGQKQRVAIAGMLAMRPHVMVLDEATAMLDPEGRREVWSVIKTLNRDLGMTVIVITQLMEEAALCDRIAVLHHGRLEMLDTPRAIFREAVRLREFGLDAPVIVNIRDRLNAAGIALADEPINVHELTNAIVAKYEAKEKS